MAVFFDSETHLASKTSTMLAVGLSRSTQWLNGHGAAARRPQACRPLVVCSTKEGAHNKGESGIHDPLGW